ncbi:MAG: hypothetical protein QM778_08855 [Myxococcales bacterium]
MIRSALLGTYAALALQTLMGLATVPLFIKAFGAERYGYWGALLGVVQYLWVLNFGMAQTVSSRISTRAHMGRDEVARIIELGFSLYLRSCIPALVVLVPATWLVPWASMFKLDGVAAREAMWTATALVGTFLVELPFTVFRAALRGLGGVGPERAISTVVSLLRLLSAAAFVWLPPSLWLAVIILSAANMFGHLCCFLYLRVHERIPVGLAVLQHQEGERREFRASGLWYLLIQVTGTALWGSDPTLAGMLLDVRASGRASVAWRAVSAVLNIATMTGAAIAPIIARQWAQGNSDQARVLALKSTRLVAGIGTIGMLCLGGAFMPLFHAWLRTDALVPEASVLVSYCAVGAVQSWVAIFEAFVVQAGEPRGLALCAVLDVTCKLALSVLLGSKLGLVGVPLGTLLGHLFTSVAYIFWAYAKQTSTPLLECVSAIVKASLVPALAFLMVYFLSLKLSARTDDLAIVLRTLASAALFCAVYYWSGLTPDLRAKLRFWQVQR